MHGKKHNKMCHRNLEVTNDSENTEIMHKKQLFNDSPTFNSLWGGGRIC